MWSRTMRIWITFAVAIGAALTAFAFSSARAFDDSVRTTDFLSMLGPRVGKRVRMEKDGSEFIITIFEKNTRGEDDDSRGNSIFYNRTLVAVADKFITLH